MVGAGAKCDMSCRATQLPGHCDHKPWNHQGNVPPGYVTRTTFLCHASCVHFVCASTLCCLGMIEDVTAMAVRVLGGRWYKCPNGHAYYVDKCGRPTVVQKCSTCGVDIGGTDHNPLPGQVDLDPKLEGNTEYSQVGHSLRVAVLGLVCLSLRLAMPHSLLCWQKSAVEDHSEANYCLRDAEEEKNPFDTVRGLPAAANRTQRFLLHAALCAGALVGGRTWLRVRGRLPPFRCFVKEVIL